MTPADLAALAVARADDDTALADLLPDDPAVLAEVVGILAGEVAVLTAATAERQAVDADLEAVARLGDTADTATVDEVLLAAVAAVEAALDGRPRDLVVCLLGRQNVVSTAMAAVAAMALTAPSPGGYGGARDVLAEVRARLLTSADSPDS